MWHHASIFLGTQLTWKRPASIFLDFISDSRRFKYSRLCRGSRVGRWSALVVSISCIFWNAICFLKEHRIKEHEQNKMRTNKNNLVKLHQSKRPARTTTQAAGRVYLELSLSETWDFCFTKFKQAPKGFQQRRSKFQRAALNLHWNSKKNSSDI